MKCLGLWFSLRKIEQRVKNFQGLLSHLFLISTQILLSFSIITYASVSYVVSGSCMLYLVTLLKKEI